MAVKYVALTQKQITALENQHCSCDNWESVSVSTDFSTKTIKNTTFSGKIKLGKFDRTISFYGGIKKAAGIYHAYLHNCNIGDNVYIANITNYIANYNIEDDCVIDHIDLLAAEGKSSFGNGTEAAVINEAGGREIPIFDGLTAQLGYIMAVYRDRQKTLEKLTGMIEKYAESVRSDIGTVAKGAIVSNCGTIKNVKIGQYAIIGNAKRLENGTIKSCKQDPTEVGANVIAKNFIIAEGAKISDGSIITDCFIGQATKLTKQFSAENSVFFANCGFHHGEACSIFAGPYTVTHHKSTLLIAGLFSFFNAGSNSNQSNHMYKSGSVHQGVLERGTKTTSGSYIMYPAKIGAFNVVMGRHYAHPDTSDIPFSYIFEEDGKSFVIPGVNLRTVGTVRDSEKWPKRDGRKSPTKTDLIIFDVLSPYTVAKIIKGLDLLLNLRPAGANTTRQVVCNNMHFNASSLYKGIEYYTIAINKYLGDCLIEKIHQAQPKSITDLEAIFETDEMPGKEKWVDIAGLLVPADCVDKLLEKIENGKLTAIEAICCELKKFYDNYENYRWAWAAEKIRNIIAKQPPLSRTNALLEIISDWEKACQNMDDLILADARKEFAQVAQIGFGPDGDENTKAADFEAVRGKYQNNGFVNQVTEQSRKAKETAAKIKEKITLLQKQDPVVN